MKNEILDSFSEDLDDYNRSYLIVLLTTLLISSIILFSIGIYFYMQDENGLLSTTDKYGGLIMLLTFVINSIGIVIWGKCNSEKLSNKFFLVPCLLVFLFIGLISGLSGTHCIFAYLI